jgi:hypothetical protein
MEGASLFVNTYWIRYPWRGLDFDDAVRNSKLLFDAANRAGVGRVVHVSVSNPERGDAFEYFRGKLAVEEALRPTADESPEAFFARIAGQSADHG